MDIGKLILRFIIAALVLGVVAFFTRGIVVSGGFLTLVLASVVIAVLDSLAQKILGVKASPFGAGLVGFVTTAIILFLAGQVVSGFTVTLWGAVVGAIVLGIVDAILPRGSRIL